MSRDTWKIVYSRDRCKSTSAATETPSSVSSSALASRLALAEMSFNPGASTENLKRQIFGDNRRSFRRKNQPISSSSSTNSNTRSRQPSNNNNNNGGNNSNGLGTNYNSNVNSNPGSNNNHHNNNNNTSSNNNNHAKRLNNSNLQANNQSGGPRRNTKSRPTKSSNLRKSASAKEESPSNDLLSEYEDSKEKVIIPSQQPQKLLSYLPEEISSTGSIFGNPEALGFRRKPLNSIPARPVPAYLLPHTRLLVTPVFQQNEWDKANQNKMLQIEASNKGSEFQGIYEEFQKMREVERNKMEDLGLVDAEHIAKDLNDAISFQGSCLDMCPVYERVRRALENNVKSFEKDPQTNKIDRLRAVKAFSRPAAGQPPPLPSDVRPPHVLKNTLDYLVDHIVEQLPASHSFLWDRTRSIRQDFTYQNFFGPEAIDCNERIVRIHLLSLHVMAGSDMEYSQQQELEQFNKALQTLIEIYDDIRKHGGRAPNEAEFRAYYLLSHLRDPELEREIQSLPNEIMLDSNVQLALYFRSIVAQNNIVERGYINTPGASNLFFDFFNVVYSDRTPLLMACLMETHFNEIRFYALKSMTRSYHSKSKKYPTHQLKDFLGYDTTDKLVKFLAYYEVDIVYDNGVQEVDLFNKEKLENKYKLNSINEKPRFAQPYSPQIDSKISGRSMASFINCGHPNNNLNLKSPSQRPITKSNLGSTTQYGSKTPQTQVPLSMAGSGGGFGAVPSSLFFTNNSQSIKPQMSNPSAPTISFETTKVQIPSKLIPEVSKDNLSSGNKMPPQLNPLSSGSLFQGTNPKLNFPSSTISQTPAASNFIKQTSPAKLAEIPKVQLNNLFSFSSNTDSDSQNKIPPVGIKPTVTTATSMSSMTIPKLNTPTSVSKVSRLVEDPKFTKASSMMIDELIEENVQRMLSDLIPRVITYENRNRERRLIIESLSSELLSAFVSEFTYNSALEAYGDYVYSIKCKRNAIKRLISAGQKLHAKQVYHRTKLNELSSVSFRGGFAKPLRSFSASSSANSSMTSVSSSVISHHRKRQRVMSTNDIGSRKKVIRDLWGALDLEEFLLECSQNVKLGVERSQIELKFLLVVEDWSTPYSKWLKNKLTLKPNLEKNIYENKLSNGRLGIKLLSLPAKEHLSNNFFMDTGFMLFECGVVGTSDNNSGIVSIHDKLEHDSKILAKLVQLVTQFGYYKVHLIIVYWNNSGVKLNVSEVREILKIDGFSNDIVKQTVFCDMAKENGNVNSELGEAFASVSANFRGDLTPKGIKKRQKIKLANTMTPVIESSTPSAVSMTTQPMPDRFKEREEQALRQAKAARKYGYLQTYAKKPRDDSFNRSMNRTYNNTTTFMNLINSRYNVSSSTINTLGIANASILNGLGNGIVVESTPATSPRRSSVPAEMPFVKPAAPKQIQQLQSLTAGILAKYKKNKS